MFGWLVRWWNGDPEPEPVSRLRKIADERGGDLHVFTLGPASYLVRIEWFVGDRIYGGEGRGTTAERAAQQLLMSLRFRGVI